MAHWPNFGCHFHYQYYGTRFSRIPEEVQQQELASYFLLSHLLSAVVHVVSISHTVTINIVMPLLRRPPLPPLHLSTSHLSLHRTKSTSSIIPENEILSEYKDSPLHTLSIWIRFDAAISRHRCLSGRPLNTPERILQY